MVNTATSEDKYCCSKCKSCHVDFYSYKGRKYQSCLDCGYEEDRNALYTLAFDEVMIKQLQKAAKQQQVKNILQSMLDELEIKGPNAGKLRDSHLFIYEIKNKHPPIRLYFRHNLQTDEIYVFEFEMKTSEEKQQRTIAKIKLKVKNF